MAPDRVQPTIPMTPEMHEEIGDIADRYGMTKTHVMRQMLRAGLQDVHEDGMDRLAERARGYETQAEPVGGD